MPLSWLQLARDGAPTASESTTKMIKENARKVFGEPPTVSPDGELIVKGAVFKPRPRNKAPAEDATPTLSAAMPSRAPSASSRPSATSRTPPTARAGSSSSALEPMVHLDDEHSDDDDVAAGVASYYELMDELTTRYNCDAVRRKIQRFLTRKTMTQTAFLKAIQVNHNSFSKFMSYSGRDKGHNNKTYAQALLYFHENEPLEAPPSVSSAAQAPSASSDKEPKVSRREQNAKAEAFFTKISRVPLPEPVYVFDDCDDVRKKLYELIESKSITQTALTKHLGVNTNSLRRFMTTKGKREGCSMNVYKLAYVMFEKLRIAKGEPKTKKRLQSEKERPQGFSLKRDPTHFYVTADEVLEWGME